MTLERPPGPEAPPRPARITLTYLAFGLLWIWFTDGFLAGFGLDGRDWFLAAAGKGTAFVLLSAALIFGLARREFRVAAHAAHLLRAVADGTTDAMFVKDRDGRYLLFNAAAARLVGKTVAEVLGRDDTALFDPDGARRVMALDRCIMESGRPLTSEEVLTSAGVTRTYLATKAPYRDETGAVAGVIGISRDVTDHKRDEESLRDSVWRFRSVFEHAATGIGITDPDGRFLQCNPAYCATLGLTEAELREADLAQLIHPDDRAENMALLRQLSAGEIPGYEIENRFLHASGEPRWVHKWVTALRDAEGRTKCLMALVTDVTERRRSEAELRASEERSRKGAALLSAVMDALPVSVIIADPVGRIVRTNPASERIWGRAPTADSVDGYREYVGYWPDTGRRIEPHEWPMSRAVLNGLTATAVGVTIERAGDRTRRRLELSAAPVIGDAGERLGGVVACLDVTERVAAETLLTSVLDNVLDAVIGIDEGGTVRSFNRAAERIFGFTAAEVLGRNVNTLMPEPDRSRHDGYLANYLTTGSAKVIGAGREVVARRKNGETFPADLAVSAFWLDDHRYFTGVVRDISERRQLEDQYRHAQKMEAVGRLAGGIAHDFNNLLTVINGYSKIVLDEMPDGDPHRESVGMVRDAGKRAAVLTRQLLAFSRKQVLQPTTLNLNDLLDGMSRMLAQLIGADVDLTVRGAPEPWPVRADAGQVEQVVMNLAVNARDAMPTGGRLTIETGNVTLDTGYTAAHPEARPGEYVRLAVTDTGCGMDVVTKARIFEPFFTTKGENGTGLGLATVFGIVKQSGGHVEVYSELGVGTTFKVYLPRDRSDPSPADSAGALRAPPTRGSETVLLAEDEDGVRRLAKMVLQRAGYTVLEAHHGGEALRICEQHEGPIHLLATDVVMPNMGGRQAAERLRAMRPEMKVLFLSGYTDDTVVRHGVLEAEVAFLQKPFSPDALAQKVREVLDAAR
ncbi:Blue-light-activated protein [Gemmata obscuriglobus]|nr:PAS domain S-box protein [Gemmata obscuriglobus]QEG30215.1 Blue-light-activated protein [Gemmata obscuriglobus]VTS09539.1 pas domain s-box : PAS domain S-box OS=Desulfomonile tiedjei (strain ATCC 49306 / DSM 6799 / DCB-1) GN=Desti_1404 PE=4 SV=1: PAS_4: PAS_9: PAS_4: PAS_9: HisKA: HATPase_c: Response_reg [Gemmata obscuriglobus UQM 2246]